jgi:Alpha/beta hydrolase family
METNTPVGGERLTLGRLRAIGVEGPSQTTWVFMLGLRCRFVRFLPVLQSLASMGQRAVLINPLDPRSGEPDLDRSADLAVGALRAIEDPKILVAHSMATALVGRCQNFVDAIVLAAPPSFPLEEQLLGQVASATLVASLRPSIRWPILEWQARRWRAAGYGDFSAADVPRELQAAAQLTPRLEARFNPRDLRVPVLSTLHEKDNVFPVTTMHRHELRGRGPLGALRRVRLLSDVRHTPTGPAEVLSFTSALVEFATDLSNRKLD